MIEKIFPNIKVNLVIIQPGNYIHSLAFLDPANYFRQWLNSNGIDATLSKNRLRQDAVNVIYGAHLGIPASWEHSKYCKFFFNLEQIGPGGADITPEYLEILKTKNIIDYDVTNVLSYRESPEEVTVVSFLNDPSLNLNEQNTIEERPIDLLFFGCMNSKRKAFIKKIEDCGLDVCVFDKPTYSEERNNIIRQSKAVINTSFYESARFEQIRAYSVLSLGTPFISEHTERNKQLPGYENSVFWIKPTEIERFFKSTFGTPDWYEQARKKLSAWRLTDASTDYAALLKRMIETWSKHSTLPEKPIQTKTKLLIPTTNEYKHNYWNISKEPHHQPDILLDLHSIQNWPYACTTQFGESTIITEESLDTIEVHQTTETQTKITQLLNNAIKLLKSNGAIKFVLQPPNTIHLPPQSTRVRFDNIDITPFSNNFWESGFFNYKFVLTKCSWIDNDYKICDRGKAVFLEITLIKTETTMQERNLARVYRADFGLYS